MSSAEPRPQDARSTSIADGPPDLRYYPMYRLLVWQPHGPLTDALLDEIALFMTKAEEVSLPFKRYIDLSGITSILLQESHIVATAKRARQYHGLAPVRCGLYCPAKAVFGVGRRFERRMKGSVVDARAFRERTAAAAWLEVPVEILISSHQPTCRR